MTDVYLFHTPDGGNIEIVNGAITMEAGIVTAAYLSLFGGNERDSGLPRDERLQWWGNLDEPDADNRYRSQTQYALKSLPATPSNLLRLEDAMRNDLAWMTRHFANQINATATLQDVNLVLLQPEIFVGDERYALEYLEAWG